MEQVSLHARAVGGAGQLDLDLDDELLTSEQVGETLKLRPQTLMNLRSTGRGPRFIKLGPERNAPVRYPRRALLQWLAENNATEA